MNDGTGRFDATPCLVLPSESARSNVPGDFNNDGAIDLAVPHRDGGQSLIFLNDGKAGFGKTMAFGPAVTNARAAAAGDLNGDGWLDLVVGYERTGTRVYLNDGRGAVYGLALADLSGDGFPDIAAAMSDAPNVVFFSVK